MGGSTGLFNCKVPNDLFFEFSLSKTWREERAWGSLKELSTLEFSSFREWEDPSVAQEP